MNGRPLIDVSSLPKSVMDHRSPIWWGNLWLLVIETTMFAVAIATYLYFRVVDFDLWPPPRVDQMPVLYHPVPDLGVATVNLGIILLSLLPMIYVDRACLEKNQTAVKFGLVICLLFGLGAIALRFIEFQAIHFRWNDNAYASTVWLLMGLHLAHLITATSENAIMTAWIFAKGMDTKHARDVRVTAVYWYWVVGIWILLYGLIYWVPRWF
jgi:cytochrome c oxidase subunit 3